MKCQKRQKKAQSAIEFLVVVVLGLFLIIPATSIVLKDSQINAQQTKMNQLQILGQEILLASEEISVLAPGSSINLELKLPDGVESAEIVKTSDSQGALVIRQKTTDGITDLVFFSENFAFNVGENESQTCETLKCSINFKENFTNLKIQHDADGSIRFEKKYEQIYPTCQTGNDCETNGDICIEGYCVKECAGTGNDYRCSTGGQEYTKYGICTQKITNSETTYECDGTYATKYDGTTYNECYDNIPEKNPCDPDSLAGGYENGAGYYCKKGECINPNNPPSCETTKECEGKVDGNPVCVEGLCQDKCLASPLDSVNRCSVGDESYLESGICVMQITSTVPIVICDKNEAATKNNMLFESCNSINTISNGDKCDPDSLIDSNSIGFDYYCHEGQCIECYEHTQCGTGNACIQNKCVETKGDCTTDSSQCLDNTVCIENKCLNNCINGLACAPKSASTQPENYGICTFSEYNGENSCDNNVTAKDENGIYHTSCFTNKRKLPIGTPCDPDNLAPPNLNYYCDGDYSCVECTQDDHCGINQECNQNNICEDLYVSCDSQANCQTGEKCVKLNGEYVCKNSCFNNQACINEIGNDGFCTNNTDSKVNAFECDTELAAYQTGPDIYLDTCYTHIDLDNGIKIINNGMKCDFDGFGGDNPINVNQGECYNGNCLGCGDGICSQEINEDEINCKQDCECTTSDSCDNGYCTPENTCQAYILGNLCTTIENPNILGIVSFNSQIQSFSCENNVGYKDNPSTDMYYSDCPASPTTDSCGIINQDTQTYEAKGICKNNLCVKEINTKYNQPTVSIYGSTKNVCGDQQSANKFCELNKYTSATINERKTQNYNGVTWTYHWQSKICDIHSITCTKYVSAY
ncbi:hypothetical protein K9L67_00650 [Candidatus Woesearchaeota archaeon]|nr:hypothetical protein [Candidatus Woesearchaeota archaeon]MCF7900716.1 hypothetical protein [Candidatus Woesearchaeota archaeon]MCF8013237.1 hypothetical protein [Candidatus Woesearchaeota archaeon]